MGTYEQLELSTRGPVRIIAMDRTRYRNAQSRQLLREIDDAMLDADADGSVKVIILTSTGKDFSSGHDLGTPEERNDDAGPRMPIELSGREEWSWRHWTEPLQRWRRLGTPTIAAMSGYCLWGGWSLASAMDLRIATPSTVILPHLSEFFTLPWHVSIAKAKEILFANRVVEANEALELGMVNRIVNGDVVDAATEMALEIAAMPAEFLHAIKWSLNNVEDIAGFDASIAYSNSQHLMSEWGRSELTVSGPVDGSREPMNLLAIALNKYKEKHS
jgi:enoyl-CoA hydratase